MSNLMSWALKRALRVLIIVCASRRLLRIVRLIRRPIILNIIVGAALREVSAAERFRRGLEELRTLLDSDPRLQLQTLFGQGVTNSQTASARKMPATF